MLPENNTGKDVEITESTQALKGMKQYRTPKQSKDTKDTGDNDPTNKEDPTIGSTRKENRDRNPDGKLENTLTKLSISEYNENKHSELTKGKEQDNAKQTDKFNPSELANKTLLKETTQKPSTTKTTLGDTNHNSTIPNEMMTLAIQNITQPNITILTITHHIITESITKRRANRSQNPKRQISNRTLLLLLTTVIPIVKGSTTNGDLEASSQDDTYLSTTQTMAMMGAIILAIWYLTYPGTAHLTPWSGRNMNPRKPQASALPIILDHSTSGSEDKYKANNTAEREYIKMATQHANTRAHKEQPHGLGRYGRAIGIDKDDAILDAAIAENTAAAARAVANAPTDNSYFSAADLARVSTLIQPPGIHHDALRKFGEYVTPTADHENWEAHNQRPYLEKSYEETLMQNTGNESWPLTFPDEPESNTINRASDPMTCIYGNHDNIKLDNFGKHLKKCCEALKQGKLKPSDERKGGKKTSRVKGESYHKGTVLINKRNEQRLT